MSAGLKQRSEKETLLRGRGNFRSMHFPSKVDPLFLGATFLSRISTGLA